MAAEAADEHAAKFAAEWSSDFERIVAQRLRQFGVAEKQIGTVGESSGAMRAFHPDEFAGGSVALNGISADAGILIDPLLESEAWRFGRLRDRLDAVLVHEITEHEFVAIQPGEVDFETSHALALRFAPESALVGLISPTARAILSEMAE